MAEYSLEPSALAGWLPLFLDDNVDDAILERVGLGFKKATADLSNLFPRPPRLLWLKLGQNAALDDINKVRLCFLSQNYTNNQSKIQNNASSAF